MPTRIALADDQALVREGLKLVLRAMGIDIAFEAADGRELVDRLAETRVDVVVSDVRMPKLTGIEALKVLRARGDTTPLILLTTFDDSQVMLEAVEAGAQGFLLKDAAPEDLRDGILSVQKGDSLLQPVATDAVRARFTYRETSAPTGNFGEREVAILRLLAGGYSNKEIARSVFLAEGTVKNYVSDILAKLEARDRTQAVLKAITLRII
ncbi:MAG TPA: response regulator transcription factor [Steroidobacteraceae bacterium]